jgi:acetoacetyl-CoA synthetase
MEPITEGTLLWQPTPAQQQHNQLANYMAWLQREKGLIFDDYQALWQWSVDQIDAFWESLWQFFAIQASVSYRQVLGQRSMPGAEWFPGAQLSYVAHVFRNASSAYPAIIAESETRPTLELRWNDLERQVAAVAAGLQRLGVERGDRVVAYLPNIPEAVVAFLATASLGAIWSSCSPDMGEASVIDRFSQIEPKVLFTIDGYRYGGKDFDRRTNVATLRANLPTITHTVLVPYLDPAVAAFDEQTTRWPALLDNDAALYCEDLPFDHPLWVLYSSGTTGLPKPIVQSQGGILLEHLKSVALHLNLGPGDRFFWFSTTGWMMWNFLVGGLLNGCTIMLFDGNPGFPDLTRLWQFAAQHQISFFGTSAAYIQACMKADLYPGRDLDLTSLRALGSTGSPLPIDGFAWVYERVAADLWLVSLSGGTDVCTAFVGGCPLWPVHAGEIQCRCLGARVESFDDHGEPVFDQVGELVISAPMPSMPIYFWNDPGKRRYLESYFEQYRGIWRHGDWVKITPRHGLVIYGRSDSTINRQGVRMGTSEMYRVVEALPDVLDSLVIDLEGLDGLAYMPLFVVLRPGTELDAALTQQIKHTIRTALSPRHVPDDIFAIPEVPRTLNGKKLEVPIKKILRGVSIAKAANPDAMSNPHTLAYFAELASRLKRS